MRESVTSPTSFDSNSPEKPLPHSQYLRNLAFATLLIALFYGFCVLSLGIGVLVWAATAIIGILGAQYGATFLLGMVVVPLGQALLAFARSLKIGRSKEFRISLSREEAPRLWTEVDELARVMGVASPRQITLENGVSAWVELRGVAAGRGRTRLGVGIDLLVGLSPAEGRAVFAHEIAHAKHVKRGYQGFLMRGLWRLNQCRATLEAIANYEKNAKGVRALAKNANRIPIWLAEKAGRSVAACSRFDEFEADREAALLCGADVARRALLTTHVLDERASRLSYRERLLHLGRGDVSWLEAQLQVRDDEHRQAIENQALAYARRDEFSTHPALPDRLAALESLPPAKQSFAPTASSTTFWLAMPKESSIRLFEQVEKLAAEQERAETRALAKHMKKQAREQKGTAKYRAGRRLLEGIAAIVVGLMFAIATAFALTSPKSDDVAAGAFFGMLTAGFWGFGAWSLWPKPARLQLHVFSYGDYREAIEARSVRRNEQSIRSDATRHLNDTEKRRAQVQEELWREEERSALSASLRAGMTPDVQTPTARTRFWNQRGFETLSNADFERAALYARLSLESQPKNNPEAWLLHGLVLAFRGQNGAKECIEAALKHEIDSASAEWARALWHFLAGSWGSSEALLLELCRQRPKEPTLLALLGGAQSANGKARESLATRRQALQLYQRAPKPAPKDEAWYRFDLAHSLVSLGQTKAAHEELSWIENHPLEGEPVIGSWNLELEWLRLAVAEADDEAIGACVTRVEALRNDPTALLRIASVVSEHRSSLCWEMTRALYEHLLQIGHYPQAHMALAQLSLEQDDHVQARKHCLAALNCFLQRPSDAAHPLSVLGDALNGLRILDKQTPVKVQSFEIQLDASNWDIGPDKITFLCFFESEAQARLAATEVFAALVPGRDVTSHISVKPAPEDIVPKDPIMPGIMDFKTE